MELVLNIFQLLCTKWYKQVMLSLLLSNVKIRSWLELLV